MKTTRPGINDEAKEWSLPFNRSFVIQIETRSKVTVKSFRGRVEHMASGRMAHFNSTDELLGFFKSNLEQEIKGTEKRPD